MKHNNNNNYYYYYHHYYYYCCYYYYYYCIHGLLHGSCYVQIVADDIAMGYNAILPNTRKVFARMSI